MSSHFWSWLWLGALAVIQLGCLPTPTVRMEPKTIILGSDMPFQMEGPHLIMDESLKNPFTQ